MEDTEASSTSASSTAVRFDGALESLVGMHAHRATLREILALGPDDVPAARDRFVGVPVLLSPSGTAFVLRSHSHAAVARAALTDAGIPFDTDHPDRTLGKDFGWVMAQAAGGEGMRLQIDRRPTARQRDAIEDLLLFENLAGRRVSLHWGRPMHWSPERLTWEPNRRFVDTSDPAEIRDLLAEGVPVP